MMSKPVRPAIILVSPEEVLEALRNSGPIRDWLEFIAHDYEPPEGKRLLLLYPCSSIKPYSASRLYRTLYSTLEKLGPLRNEIHVISVSEPFGLVPEDLYGKMDALGWYECPALFRWWCQKHKVPYRPEVVRECLSILANYVAAYFSRTRDHYEYRLAFVRTYSSGLRRTLSHTHAIIIEEASRISGVDVELAPPTDVIINIVKTRGRLAWDFYGVAHPMAQEFLLRRLEELLNQGLRGRRRG